MAANCSKNPDEKPPRPSSRERPPQTLSEILVETARSGWALSSSATPSRVPSTTAVLHPSNQQIQLLRDIHERLSSALPETSAEDQANARQHITATLELLPKNERLRGFGMIADIVDKLRENGISPRAICNNRLNQIKRNLIRETLCSELAKVGLRAEELDAQELEEKEKTLPLAEKADPEFLEAIRKYYCSHDFDDAVRRRDDFASINTRIAGMPSAPQMRAALLASGLDDYLEFERRLECDAAAGQSGEDKELYALGEIFPPGMGAVLRGSVFKTPLHINFAYFSVAEVSYIASFADAIYKNPVEASAFKMSILRSVLWIASEKMPPGHRAESIRLIAESMSELVEDRKSPHDIINNWLDHLVRRIAAFENEDNALAELRKIAKDPEMVI